MGALVYYHNVLQFDYITNKPACLAHDAMQLEYIPVILSTIAAFGPHLIHPFFAKTKGKSTHSELREYFVTLYNSLMKKHIDSNFFEMSQPAFEGVSKNMFDSMKKNEYFSKMLSKLFQIWPVSI